jgi:hypothetical protein
LICPQCSTPIPAGLEEVAWACAQCGQGIVLDESLGLERLEIHYSAEIPPNARGKPFWVADGRARMQRQTYGSAGKQGQQAEAYWSQPRRFFVPAFQAPLERLLELARGMLLNPPALSPGPAAPFEPVTLYRADVLSAAEFIVMAVEAGRKDQLKSIDFELQLSKPVLWILP